MSAPTAIELIGVSKYFYRHTGRALLRTHLQSWLRRSPQQRFYALKNVTFRVESGEGVAVIGSNGAGKSTLLSLVAGLAEADAGVVSVNGRLGALLQLGAGFHPDLTGKENVWLNASLLGLSRGQTARLFDSIVEFSGIGEFIQEPLRTYSTGMTMRLAFSVAVQMDPDILIIDEVLAVGDHTFQVKCFDRIRELRRRGKTLLCVSHSTAALQPLCDRAVWLDGGELLMDGPIADVIDAYQGRMPSSRA